ncbi:MAG TPA: DUF3276 family protein [Bacteroidales bacterium]|nr:DUF3276 family protein [Bacteroidales bacterium]
MEEDAETHDGNDSHDERVVKDEIYTKIVRAGKRTYFFDVKATRRDDYYLTITESKKRLGKEGKTFYEKHKIFLYKEDFEKFANGLKDVVNYIDNGRKSSNKNIGASGSDVRYEAPVLASVEFTNVEFDDLGDK